MSEAVSSRHCRDEDWMRECDAWLYSRAWLEWTPHEIEHGSHSPPQALKYLNETPQALKRIPRRHSPRFTDEASFHQNWEFR